MGSVANGEWGQYETISETMTQRVANYEKKKRKGSATEWVLEPVANGRKMRNIKRRMGMSIMRPTVRP